MQNSSAQTNGLQMIAIDMDGTLLGDDGRVSPRNLSALRAAQAAGIEVVVATGRRHSYAMHVLRPLGLDPSSVLISSNGTVTRTLGSHSPGSEPVPSQLIARTYLPRATALWLCGHVDEFRNALVLTFDRVGPDGDDVRGALVVEHLDELNASIGRWMAANEPYIAHVNPIESALVSDAKAGGSNPGSLNPDAPIQAMLCGTVDRMRRAEARLLEHPGVIASGHPSGRSGRTMNGPATAGASHPIPGAPHLGAPGELASWGEHLASEMWDPNHQSPGAPSFAASSQTRAPSGRSLPAGVERVGSRGFEPEREPAPILALNRTDYPGRDLSILDILPAGCSKGAALLSLASTHGIDAAQVLAIGDNWNDVSMLEAAGAAVVMDNAPEDLKVFARTRGWRIGPSNCDDGVAQAIEAALAVTC